MYTLEKNLDNVIYESNPFRPGVPSKPLACLGEIAIFNNATGIHKVLSQFKGITLEALIIANRR